MEMKTRATCAVIDRGYFFFHLRSKVTTVLVAARDSRLSSIYIYTYTYIYIYRGSCNILRAIAFRRGTWKTSVNFSETCAAFSDDAVSQWRSPSVTIRRRFLRKNHREQRSFPSDTLNSDKRCSDDK